MALFILYVKDDCKVWKDFYSTRDYSVLIRAVSEEEARRLATQRCYDSMARALAQNEIWMDSKHTGCDAISPDGNTAILLESWVRN